MIRTLVYCTHCELQKPAYRFNEDKKICKKCSGYIIRSRKRKLGLTYKTQKNQKDTPSFNNNYLNLH